jgi:hypothetical protein
MKPMFSSFLIGALFVVFTLVAACGVWLIATSADTARSQSTAQADPASKLELNVNVKGVKLELTTAIPGLIVFVMGTLGLLFIAIRVPVKQIRGYERPPKLPPGAIGLVTGLMLTPEPILGDKIERIPLLLWWLIRGRGRAIRVAPSTDST